MGIDRFRGIRGDRAPSICLWSVEPKQKDRVNDVMRCNENISSTEEWISLVPCGMEDGIEPCHPKRIGSCV